MTTLVVLSVVDIVLLIAGLALYLWIVGPDAFRAARRRGEGPFPAPVFSARARTITITGKDGNEIPLLGAHKPASKRATL